MSLSPQIVALITGIGGLVVPPIVSLLKRSTWPASLKQLVAAVLSGAVACVAIAIVDPADFGLPFVTLAGLVYAGSQLVYAAFFKGSVVEVALAKVGEKKPVPPAISG